MMKNELDVIRLIRSDNEMMDILNAAKTLNLPDWWICAGFVRSKIWDHLHGFQERTRTQDVDVIYYDKNHIDETLEKELENKLRGILPNVPWSVKNQARMHVINSIPPYTSAEDAISKFTETVTALGITLAEDNSLILTAPHGLDDVLHLQVKPTPFFTETKERFAIYENRVKKKNWKENWPMVTIHQM